MSDRFGGYPGGYGGYGGNGYGHHGAGGYGYPGQYGYGGLGGGYNGGFGINKEAFLLEKLFTLIQFALIQQDSVALIKEVKAETRSSVVKDLMKPIRNLQVEMSKAALVLEKPTLDSLEPSVVCLVNPDF
jgi:uncharacterized membrane protein